MLVVRRSKSLSQITRWADPMLRFVVLSDLHAHQQDVDDASAPSRLSLLSRHQDKAVNPVAAFPEALKSADFAPQLVICPGDLGDKNDGVAQQYAWAALEGLKKKVHANRLIGVVGNHDLDSRRTDTAQLPNSNLKTLSPTFPLSSKAKSSNYWSDGRAGSGNLNSGDKWNFCLTSA